MISVFTRSLSEIGHKMVICKPLLISNPYDLWVFVLQAAILGGKNFNIVCYAQTFQLQIVVPAMLMETIDCYHFIQLSVTLTLAGRHKVSTMQNLLASFSSTLFISGCGGEAVQVEDLNFNLEWDLFNQASKTLMLACIWTFISWFYSNWAWW